MKKEPLSFNDLLLLSLIVLKLCKVIDWPWIWVISPLWVSIIISVIIVLFKKEDKPDKEKRDKEKSLWIERLEQMKKEREMMDKNLGL